MNDIMWELANAFYSGRKHRFCQICGNQLQENEDDVCHDCELEFIVFCVEAKKTEEGDE